jgi:hypothetical protein
MVETSLSLRRGPERFEGSKTHGHEYDCPICHESSGQVRSTTWIQWQNSPRRRDLPVPVDLHGPNSPLVAAQANAVSPGPPFGRGTGRRKHTGIPEPGQFCPVDGCEGCARATWSALHALKNLPNLFALCTTHIWNFLNLSLHGTRQLCPHASANVIGDWCCRELELLAQKLANTEDEYEALYDQKLAGRYVVHSIAY